MQDIVLLGNDSNKKIPAHKLVLLNLGSKFQKYYLEKKEPTLQSLLRMDAPTTIVEELVKFAYRGKCNLNSGILRDMLVLAKDMEIFGLLKLGAEFILHNLRACNSLESYRLAKEFLCVDVKDLIKKFILQNFNVITKQDHSFGDCPVPDLEEFLKDDELNVKEEQLFEILIDWANQDLRRQEPLPDLIKHVRFTLMASEYFETKVENSQLINSNKALAKQVAQAKSFFLRMARTRSTTLKLVTSKLSHKTRIPSEIVFAIGGWSAEPNGPTSCIETFDVRSYKWNTMKVNASSPRAYHGLAMTGKKIYLFGGYDGEEYFSATSCYDPVSKVWEDKAPMYHARCYVSSTVHDGKVYAVGGFNGRTRLNSIECYSPLINMWTLLPPMRIVRSDASAVTYDDKIYVIGGFTGEEILDSVEIYDPALKEWSFGPRLNTVRSGVKSVVYQDKIFVLGGFDGHNRLKTG